MRRSGLESELPMVFDELTVSDMLEYRSLAFFRFSCVLNFGYRSSRFLSGWVTL